MKQLKRIITLVFLFILSSIFQTNIENVNAAYADTNLGYGVHLSQNILYYDYNQTNTRILNLQEVRFYQIGNIQYSHKKDGWIMKDGTTIFKHQFYDYSFCQYKTSIIE